jgi:hypothetical protein
VFDIVFKKSKGSMISSLRRGLVNIANLICRDDVMEKEIEISPYGSLLVYKKGYSLDFIRTTIQKKQLKGLRIFAQLKEDRLNSLDFLREYTFLEALGITTVDDFDFGFLSELKGLKELTISTVGEHKIDLSSQVNLEELAIHWRKGGILGIGKCQNLTSLCLIDFKESDFSAISQLIKLKELIVKTASIKTVNGLQNFQCLESLLLGNCRSLRSIEGITYLKELTSLDIELCSKIDDYNFIGSLYNLKSLDINDCKGINSIKFVQNLQALQKIGLLGNTDVLDSDMTPAQNIKEVFYYPRKHYNIKIENKDFDNLRARNMKKINDLFG